MFHHDWKLQIRGQLFRVFLVNRGQISIFHFKTPNGTSLRDSASFERMRVKICPGVSSLRWFEKNKEIKSHKKVIFHPFAQNATVNEFSQNLYKCFPRRHNQNRYEHLLISNVTV